MRKLLSSLSFVLLWATFAIAQERTVTGTVKASDDGSALPGVSIKVRGAATGTQTGAEGQYSIRIPDNNAVLVFSFIGFATQEVTVGARDVVNVTMGTDAQQLGEVVVTALGVTRDRKSIGYSAQSLNSEDLNRAGNPSLTSAMQGKLSGVDIKPSSGMPGASAQVVIRGARSFTGNNTPLYVVDGMPIASTADFTTGDDGDGSVQGNGVTGTDVSTRSIDIDPNDIETMTVLKGQAAAALYGVRASNGVILITTKSGKNLQQGKARITFNTNVGFDNLSRMPDFQNTWAQGSTGTYSPTSSMSWGPRVEDLPNDPLYGGNITNARTTAAGGLQNGKYFVPQLQTAGLDPWVAPAKYNNVGDFFRTGQMVTNSINMSQATDKGSYSVGLSTTNQGGIISSTAMDRYTGKLSAETRLSSAWKTGVSGNYVYSDIDKATGANDGLVATVFPAPISYNLKGIPNRTPTNPYAQIGYRSLNFNNPYWAMENNIFNEKTNRFFGNTYVAFTPSINWGRDSKLNVKYQVGIDTYASSYQDINEVGSKNLQGIVNNYGVAANVFNSLLTATYDVKLTEDIGLTALVGNEFNQDNQKRYSENGQGLNFGGWKHIDNATIRSTSEAQNRYRTVGFFGSLNTSYKSLLFLTVTGRNDVVSSMPRDNRSFFYPSVSLSYVATEMPVLKNVEALSFLKLRASYAEVGQAGTYLENYYETPTYGGGFWGGTPVVYPVNGVSAFTPSLYVYDPNLKPQNTMSKEIGFEARFFKNLFGIDYTFSRQDVKDQIFGVPLAGSTGASQLITNGGKIHTNAHEVVLNINPIRKKDLNLDLGINFSKIDNYVDALAPGVESIFLGGFTTPQVRAGINDRFPVIYGTSFQKDAQGRILVSEDPDDDYYGMPMPGEEAVIGQVAPDFLLGGTLGFRYKRVSLSSTFDWKSGGQMYSGSNGLSNLYGKSKETEDRTTPFVYPGYKSDGTPNDIQRGGASDKGAYKGLYSDRLGNIDEAYIYDASFVKMRELVLSYKLPQIRRANMNLSLYTRNILLWTKLPNFDPESSQGNTNMGGAFERFSVPQTTSYGLSLNVTF
jgi:TonB-linked SusC/RagA family outer membrane protein